MEGPTGQRKQMMPLKPCDCESRRSGTKTLQARTLHPSVAEAVLGEAHAWPRQLRPKNRRSRCRTRCHRASIREDRFSSDGADMLLVEAKHVRVGPHLAAVPVPHLALMQPTTTLDYTRVHQYVSGHLGVGSSLTWDPRWEGHGAISRIATCKESRFAARLSAT